MPSTIPAPLSGRFAIVTGGSRGIGRGVALDLAAKGAEGIAITYAGNKAAAEQTLADIKQLGCHNVIAIQADLYSPQFGETVVDAALKGLGVQELHIVVNNAGYADFDFAITFETETKENFDKYMHGNVLGPIHLIRAALPHIAPSGRIINISSAASRNANPDAIMFYGASKAAFDSMTRSLAVKYAPLKKITINSVLVGPTETEAAAAMFAQNPAIKEVFSQAPTAEKRIGSTQDVANIVSFLASEESRWINGCSVPADGGSQLARQG